MRLISNTLFIIFLVLTIGSCNHNQKTQEHLSLECEECDSLLNLALVCFENDMYEATINYCNQAIRIDSTYPINYVSKGMLLSASNKFDSAVVAFEKLYQLCDEYNIQHNELPIDVIYDMVHTYRELESYDKALMIAQEGLLTNPDNIKLMDEVCLCYALQEKYDLAEKWAMKELETHPNDVCAYFRMAWINSVLGRTEKTIEYYEKVLQMEPEDSDASTINNLANAYMQKDFNYALRLKIKAAELGDQYARKWCKENGYDY